MRRDPRTTPSPRNGRRRFFAALAALVAVLSGTLASLPAAAQDTTGGTDDSAVRIVARKLSDGRVEFALQQRSGSTWGDRQLPRTRFFPTTARVGRWLVSSPLDVTAGEVRIVARKLSDGRVEFALQQRSGSTWGDRQLPRTRFFPTTARVGRWLVSSPLDVTAPQSARRWTAVTAGNQHSCGLRADGTVTCWGYDSDGETDAPDGQFTAVSAGSYFTCGVRSNGTITCWGNNRYNSVTDAPDGQFTAVSTRSPWQDSCGLRTDGTITCWAHDPLNRDGESDALVTDAPDGQFTAMSAGAFHSCGLRTNGTITCWGDDSDGETDAPDGQFTAVSAGGAHSCGLRTDGTITCWGSNMSLYNADDDALYTGKADAPSGQFTAVSAGINFTCGVRSNGTITCWGLGQLSDAPDGRFTAVSAGGAHSCGLRTNGTITCWGDRHNTDVPD